MRGIYRILGDLKRRLIWYLEAKNEINSIDKKNKTIKNNLEGKILILIPHPDDEWIGCSTLIKENEAILVYMNQSGDDSAEIKTKREKELQKIAKKYNKILKSIVSSEELYRIIEEYKPNFVAVPAYVDWHREHHAVMDILKKALLNIEFKIKILMYQVSVPMPPFVISHCLPLSKKEWKNKWNEFHDIYKTQKDFPVVRTARNEYINGALVESYAAEAFSILESEKWIESIELFRNEIEFEKIFQYINDIHTIRCISEKLYEKSLIK